MTDQEIVRKKIPDLTTFVSDYLPMRLPMNWHHRLFYDILENKVVQGQNGLIQMNSYRTNLKDKIIDEGRVNRNIIIEAPRFHSKSQCITINYPLWELYRDHNKRIIIVSGNQDIATSFVRAIMNQLENNSKLSGDFGYLKPADLKKWGERALLIERDTAEKDPSIVGIGAGGKLISRRADIIIVDDLLDLENARTKSARSKVKEWFENVLLPILDPVNGRLIVVGTAWYKGDLYDELMNDSSFDFRLKLKSLLYKDAYFYHGKNKSLKRYIPFDLKDFPQALNADKVFDEPVQRHYQMHTQLRCGVLWKDKWPFDVQMKRKANMSSASFMRQFLNEPTAEEDAVFKERHVQMALDNGNGKSLVPSWDNITMPVGYGYGHLITAMGVDLAISKAKKADKTAISVWGLNERRQYILLYLESGKWSPDETKMRILDLNEAFHPAKIRVENIAFQEMMRQELANDDIPVEGFATTSGKKFNEESGIASMDMLAEQGKLVIPSSKANMDYYQRVMDLLAQMTGYSFDQHAGDMLMSSWFAIDTLRQFDKKMRDNRGFFSTNALVEMLRNSKAAHRVLLLGYNPPVFRFAVNSLVSIFRSVEHPELQGTPFIRPEEKFMIFSVREERSVAYIIEKVTSEIVGKIEGDVSALMYSTLLEKAGRFFNNAQIIQDRNGEGEAIYKELEKRSYPSLYCMQPSDQPHRLYEYKGGIKITEAILPMAVDYFKQMVDGLHIHVPDDALIKEMGELITVTGTKMEVSHGTGLRIKTISVALWLLDNYENQEKKSANAPKKKKKELKLPYLVFRKR